jgi:hypothetical protein
MKKIIEPEADIRVLAVGTTDIDKYASQTGINLGDCTKTPHN